MTSPDPRGFASMSSIYKVCEGLATYKRDSAHWSFDESLRTRAKRPPRSADDVASDAQALLAKLLAAKPA